MRQKSIIIIITFILVNVQAQSIRKNYLEMTDDEKINLVNAFYQLRTGPDLINDLATFHGNFFNFTSTIDPNNFSIHNNLPDRPEMDIFFAWHRRQMFEVEQAMQDINQDISIPYWDSSIDQSVNSSLWDENFMGQFNFDWGLGRNLGDFGSLPTPQEVILVQEISDYLLYSDAFERGTPHVGAHRWVGGPMRTPFSPRDPIFYLHHTNVDKLWAEWQESNQSSSFIRTSMLRYDGTYNFNGSTFPLINPNDIVNNRYFGTFYAEDGLAVLDNYTVSNTYNSQENFYYQFTIQSGNNFVVPSGNDCKFESINDILLQPGFEAISGSTFIAKIDNSLLKIPFSKRGNEIVRNQIPFDDVDNIDYDAYGNNKIAEESDLIINAFPNPFSNKITIEFGKRFTQGSIVIFDLMGRVIMKETFSHADKIEIAKLDGLSIGIYLLHVVDENNNILIVKKIVKIK